MSDQHITEITNDPNANGGAQNEFAIADTWFIDNYNAGDWNGAAGNLAQFYSDTSGSQVTLNISAIGNITVSHASFKDINVVGGIIYIDATCVNLGNNTNIVMAASMFVSSLPDGVFYVDTLGNLIYKKLYLFNSSTVINLS